MFHSIGTARRFALALATLTASLTPFVATRAQVAQKQDSAYTAQIHSLLTDPRITTELVDHLPASSKGVPTPLKFLGRIIGQPGELTHSYDIHKYMRALAAADPTRAKVFSLGTTENGGELIVMVIANEETIKNLDKYKGYLAELTDARKTSEDRARTVIKAAKPIYYITSGMHSTETGGPEMLMELAYRLMVEETPFIQDIRNNVITMITPVVEPDGRDRIVDNCYWNAKYGQSIGRMGLPYWGNYVAHDDNRDGMGQMLKLTQYIEKFGLDWHPTILHDLHEAQTLLYASTGTGPYNDQLDPITIDEWWYMAENDIIEMTKRGVPGVWTYGFYDGWVPNYMFYVVHAHNAVGRFYEVQSYGTNCSGAANAAAGGGGRGGGGGGGGGGGRGGRGGGGGGAPGAAAANTSLTMTLGGSDYSQSREWFRPNPTPDDALSHWGPRANTNIQESAILFALHNTGDQRQRFLEDYWVKGKNAVNKAKYGPIKGWVIPAGQHGQENTADAVNELLDQGLEFQTATADFKVGNVDVKKGDYIVRGDQPFRTVADIYFSIQNYPITNPSPYDDTGWTYQMLRNLWIREINDATLLTSPMTPVTGHVTAPGGVAGTGTTLVVDYQGDNTMVTFRFQFASTKMAAAEDTFNIAGHHFGRGSIIVANANRAQMEPVLKQLGLSAWAVAAAPDVRSHDLDVPRIGYIHSWSNTQDEGWVRGALDHYKIPYSYFGENAVRKQGPLKAKYDVILWPDGGAVGQGAPVGGTPIPFKKSAEFPSFGTPDSTDDMRGGLGEDGLQMLYDFVAAGGTLITEGNTAQIFPQYRLTPGVTIAAAQGLVAHGTILRGVVADMTSPIAYGMGVNQMPVYFSQGPVLDAGVPQETGGFGPAAAGAGGRGGAGGGGGGGGGGAGGRGGGGAGVYQNVEPMRTKVLHSTWDPTEMWTKAIASNQPAAGGGGGFGGRGGRGSGAAPGGGGPVLPWMRPRVILQFPADSADMLLSGELAGGEALSNRAQVVDAPIGKGHVVMFAIRPFWRWQTQGAYSLGFNTIMNWDHLDAGKAAPARQAAPGGHR